MLKYVHTGIADTEANPESGGLHRMPCAAEAGAPSLYYRDAVDIGPRVLGSSMDSMKYNENPGTNLRPSMVEPSGYHPEAVSYRAGHVACPLRHHFRSYSSNLSRQVYGEGPDSYGMECGFTTNL